MKNLEIYRLKPDFSLMSVEKQNKSYSQKNIISCKSIFVNIAYICSSELKHICGNSELCSKEPFIKFQCQSNLQKVSLYKICNYIKDCDDNSDEKYCG